MKNSLLLNGITVAAMIAPPPPTPLEVHVDGYDCENDMLQMNAKSKKAIILFFNTSIFLNKFAFYKYIRAFNCNGWVLSFKKQ